MLHPDTDKILTTQARGTVAELEIHNMRARNHPFLAILDALLRHADWHHREFDSAIANDSFAGPYWLDAARATRNMLSAASQPGFDGGACEAVFWHAMMHAGYNEEDL